MDGYDKAMLALLIMLVALLGFIVYEAATHPGTTTITITQTP